MFREQKPSTHDFHLHDARRTLLAIGFAVVLMPAAASDAFAEPPVPGPAWTTDLSKMKVPDAPVSGTIHGHRFTADKVDFDLDDRGLVLQHGKGPFGDLSVDIFLSAKRVDLLEGATFRIRPGSGGVCVAENGDRKSRAEGHDCAITLEISKVTHGVVVGKLYLCLLDEKHSVIAGTFKVGGPGTQQLTRTEIKGHIAYRGHEKNPQLVVGCLGRNQVGKLENPTIDCEPLMRPAGESGYRINAAAAPRITMFGVDLSQQIYHRHINRPPGSYLIFVTGTPEEVMGQTLQYGHGDGWYDWKWVELKDDHSTVIADLAVDPRKFGALELTVSPGGGAAPDPICVPLDASGKLPLPEALVEGQVPDLAIRVDNLGKAELRHMREGRYRLALGRATVDVAIKANTTTRVNLTARAN